MPISSPTPILAALLGVALLLSVPEAGAAQKGRTKGEAPPPETVLRADTLAAAARDRIRAYYDAHPTSDAEALPPGIRMNLARGKPLPPGIAKKVAPAALRRDLPIDDGYELVEVGPDVLLVEAATDLVVDIVRDVLR